MTKRDYKPMVYICSPFAGDIESNLMKARNYCRFAVDSGFIPIAPHLLFPQFMNDSDERDEAMHMDIILLGKCEEVWVFGNFISQGMSFEIRKAKLWHKCIRYFDEDMKEVFHD